MTFQDSSFTFQQNEAGKAATAWLDQLAQELLLTAQAFQQLQTALKAKFK